MGFKLGTNRGLEATNGEIKTKMRFGKQSGGDGSVPGTPVIRVPLEEGVMGEANMDGSIFVNENITPGSQEDKKVINHEMRHATDMRLGKLAYSDDDITYNGEIKTKLSFGRQPSGIESIPGTPIIPMPLEEGIMGEANMDGTIYVNDKIVPGSYEDRQVINHEMRHATDMKIGKLAYDDNYIKWNGEIYDRKDGHIFFNDQWVPEGSKDFPWEKMPWE